MKHHLLIMERRGTGIHLHWSWLVGLGFSLGLGLYDGWAVAVMLGSLGLLAAVHEGGHALLARCCHCPLQCIALHPLHGRCVHRLPGDGLEALREAVVAWGGMLAQAVLLVPVGVTLILRGWQDPPLLNAMLLVLGPVNGVLLLLNLVPAPGLDGHRAWRLIGLLRHYRSPAARSPQRVKTPVAPAEPVVVLADLEPDTTESVPHAVAQVPV